MNIIAQHAASGESAGSTGFYHSNVVSLAQPLCILKQGATHQVLSFGPPSGQEHYTSRRRSSNDAGVAWTLAVGFEPDPSYASMHGAPGCASIDTA